MKALIVYDSVYGNTEKIAKAVGDAITGEVKVLRVGEVNPSELKTFDLLIVGSPTHGGRPTPAIQEFLSKIPANTLKNVGVTSFDTRFQAKDKGVGIRILVGVFGYAAGRIADSLKGKGGYLVAVPEGFIVEGNEGPLKEGELERAGGWARGMVESKKQFYLLHL